MGLELPDVEREQAKLHAWMALVKSRWQYQLATLLGREGQDIGEQLGSAGRHRPTVPHRSAASSHVLLAASRTFKAGFGLAGRGRVADASSLAWRVRTPESEATWRSSARERRVGLRHHDARVRARTRDADRTAPGSSAREERHRAHRGSPPTRLQSVRIGVSDRILQSQIHRGQLAPRCWQSR